MDYAFSVIKKKKKKEKCDIDFCRQDCNFGLCSFQEMSFYLPTFRHFAMTCRAVAEKRDIISFKDKLITHPICDQYEYNIHSKLLQ